jgi:hypothetical protein
MSKVLIRCFFIGLFILGLTVSVHAQVVCDGATGHCYELVSVNPPLTWVQARDYAETLTHLGMNGHLATITSEYEQININTWFPNDAWIGGFQMNNQSDTDVGWQWVTGEPWVFTNWDGGEPNDCCDDGENNQENYLMMFDDSEWNDNDGFDALSHILVEYENCIGSVCYAPSLFCEFAGHSYCTIYIPNLINPIYVGQLSYQPCDGICPPSVCVVCTPEVVK